jgi:hypothetical protein
MYLITYTTYIGKLFIKIDVIVGSSRFKIQSAREDKREAFRDLQ